MFGGRERQGAPVGTSRSPPRLVGSRRWHDDAPRATVHAGSRRHLTQGRQELVDGQLHIAIAVERQEALHRARHSESGCSLARDAMAEVHTAGVLARLRRPGPGPVGSGPRIARPPDAQSRTPIRVVAAV